MTIAPRDIYAGANQGENSLNENPRHQDKGALESYAVVLPCEAKDFRSFVSGLLGKPQELNGEFECTFDIKHDEISNIYHLLEQRMRKQNEASLVHFSVAVYYDDGNSVIHNNVADFESFHPTTKCHPTGVTVSATYLIKFRGHDIPEKQEIEVTFSTEAQKRQGQRWFDGGLYEYRILHTERTWATDIAGLLTNHGSTVTSKPKTLQKLLRERSDSISSAISAIVLLVSLFIWANAALLVLDSTTEQLESIKFFVRFGIKSIPALAMLWLMFAAVKHYIERTSFFWKSSSIVFTEEDQKFMVEKNKIKTVAAVKFILLQLFSITMGVMANIVYSKSWWW